jgi:hypothetical protein
MIPRTVLKPKCVGSFEIGRTGGKAGVGADRTINRTVKIAGRIIEGVRGIARRPVGLNLVFGTLISAWYYKLLIRLASPAGVTAVEGQFQAFGAAR